MDIIFRDFLILNQFFFHHEWSEAWLLVKTRYIRVASRVAERRAILGKLERLGKFQNIIEF